MATTQQYGSTPPAAQGLYATTPRELFHGRVLSLLDAIAVSSEDDAITHLATFLDRENASDQSGYNPEDIRLLYCGDARRKGLFGLCGDTTMLRNDLKPHARTALMVLFNLLLNEKNMMFSSEFRTQPIAQLRKLKLNKHMMHGDPEQQMAAFRLARLIYTQYTPDQFGDVLNGKTAALDIFGRMYTQWQAQHPDVPVPQHQNLTTATGAQQPATQAVAASGPMPAATAATTTTTASTPATSTPVTSTTTAATSPSTTTRTLGSTTAPVREPTIVRPRPCAGGG